MPYQKVLLICFSAYLIWNSQTMALAQAKQDTHHVEVISPAEGVNANEVSIAINPKNPKNIVAVAMMREYGDKKGTFTNYAFFTRDGGKTWATSAVPNPRERTQGDDAIRFTSDGVALRTYISFLGIFSPQPTKAETAIMASRSPDGGANWETPVAVIEHLNTAEPMEDKPYPIVDTEPKSKYYGNAYVTWTRFDRYDSKDEEDNSQIYFSKSTDQGKSFTPAFRISDLGGDCLDDDNTVEGAVPAVGADGEVYVVWAGPRGIEFDASFDGGTTWTEDRTIYEMPGGWSSPVEGVGRHNGMPVTAVDHSQGKFRGSLYVNWIDDRNGDLDVFVGYSRDGGKTWSDPVRVNNDALKNGRPQFFSWMSVDPADGSINIVFYDRRDVDGNSAKLTLARSVDGGATFQNFPINQPVFECNSNIFMGDYTAIDARDGQVAAAYTFTTGDKRQTAIAAAIFKFNLGTQKPHQPVER